MVTRDNLGEQQEVLDAHGGRGSTLFYRMLGFFAAPGGQTDSEDLALPEEISHWVE